MFRGYRISKFICPLEQKLLNLAGNNFKNTEQVCGTVLESIEQVVVSVEIKAEENPNDWVTNKIKNAITK